MASTPKARMAREGLGDIHMAAAAAAKQATEAKAKSIQASVGPLGCGSSWAGVEAAGGAVAVATGMRGGEGGPRVSLAPGASHPALSLRQPCPNTGLSDGADSKVCQTGRPMVASIWSRLVLPLVVLAVAGAAAWGIALRLVDPLSTDVIPAEDPYTHLALTREHLRDGSIDGLNGPGAPYPPGLHAVL